MTETNTCPTCGARDVTERHVEPCRRKFTARSEAEALGATHAIPEVTTADLWAHLGHVAATHHDQTRIIRQVIDLGWRPVVGKDPRRLWKGSEAGGNRALPASGGEVAPRGHLDATRPAESHGCDSSETNEGNRP